MMTVINSVAQTGGQANTPVPQIPSAQSDLIEATMASVISGALGRRPIYGAKHYYQIVVDRLATTCHEPPSLSRFLKAFSAERGRRKALVLRASAEAAEAIGSALGDQQIQLLPNTDHIGREVIELVVSSITAMRSVRVGDAHKDYCDVSYRAQVRCISEAAYRELIYLPLVVENVRHELMPEWWTRKLSIRTK